MAQWVKGQSLLPGHIVLERHKKKRDQSSINAPSHAQNDFDK